MKLFRLTALASVCLGLVLALASCEKDDEKNKVHFHAKSDIPATGAQIAPTQSPSAATGKLSVSYDDRTKVLNYSISWSGLSDSVIAIRLNGPAPSGYAALDPTFTGANPTAVATSPYKTLQIFTGTAPRSLYPATGSYTGSVNVDNVKIREQDILNGLYYFTIHSKTTLPISGQGAFLYRWFGEIRAQVIFQ